MNSKIDIRRQTKGFFIASLKVQLRNVFILTLGIILPILLIFTYQFVYTHNFTRVKIGINLTQDYGEYVNTIKYLEGNTESYEIVKYTDDKSLEADLLNDKIDIKLWYLLNGQSPQLVVLSKDKNDVKNKIITLNLESKLNKDLLLKNNLASQSSIGTRLIPIDMGSILEPIFPILLAFAIVICCLGLHEFNIFNSKENLALRRIFAAPTIPFAFLLGQSLSRIFFCLIQMSFVLFVMMTAFGFRPINLFFSLPQILLLTIVTTIIFICQNILLASVLKRDRVLYAVNSVVLIVQFALVTGFIPLKSLPSVLQSLINILPFNSYTTLVGSINSSGLTMFSFPAILHTFNLIIWTVLLVFLAKRSFNLRHNS